jgi:hypothetical protein
MKIKNFKLFALALLAGSALMLSSCSKENNLNDQATSSQPELKAGNGPSANGQGAFYYNGVKRHFEFNARTKAGGVVQGNGVLTYNGHDIQTKFDINCMTVTGNTATLSGIVTSSTLENWPAGTPVAFTVVDNGEGGSNPDEMTLLQQSPGYDCTTWPGLWLIQIESGNIQVKP